MHQQIPITRDLVLVGGGHAHALVLQQWAMAPLPGVQVTLINPHPKAPYTGMLPGFVAGHYTRDELDIDLVRLARKANARLIFDTAIGLDTDQRRVRLLSRPDISYDTLSLDIGITSKRPLEADAGQAIITAKPLGPFARVWAQFLERLRSDAITPSVVLVGAGLAGAELALAMSHRLRTAGHEETKITLLESGHEPLRDLGNMARRRVLKALAENEIELRCGAEIAAISRDHVALKRASEKLPANLVISTAGAQPYAWLQDTGLPLEHGYVAVDKTLRVLGHSEIFAVGDCAHLSHAPRPTAGVFAVRQAPILFNNLRAHLSGGDVRAYAPQKSYLKLTSLGEKSAVSDKWGIGASGRWVWRLKDRIDQAFMQPFRDVTQMPAAARPARMAHGVEDWLDQFANPCGGCGAKVGRAPLIQGLAGDASEAASAEDLDLDDAAIVLHADRTDVFSTDHLRAFTSDAYLLAKITAIHALGDIWAMGARPHTALSQLILPPLSDRKQAEMIAQIRAGANEVFSACKTQIIGGHTSNGAELTIGFTLMGTAEQAPVTLTGAKPGDVLVLTKPIGTGVLLAAEMQQHIDGDDYKAAIDSMCRLQDRASHLLAGSASAMTDVTGFGLAGHLQNLIDASATGARLKLDTVPVLPGAEALAEVGIRSTLWPQNIKLRDHMRLPASPRADLLFDPQTCGGLLASIPAGKIDAVLADFEENGRTGLADRDDHTRARTRGTCRLRPSQDPAPDAPIFTGPR